MQQECVTHNYCAKPDNKFDFYYRGWFWMMGYQGVGGDVEQCGNSPTNDWTCKSNFYMPAPMDKQYEFNVLATDYDNWMVRYTCMDMIGSEIMWGNWLAINTRYNEPIREADLKAAEAAILAQMPDFDLSEFAMWSTSHKDCKYDFSLCGK